MLPDRGANAALCPADLDLGGAARAAAEAGGLDPEARPHLHLSGFVLLDARSRAAGLAALAEARAAGWTTSVDPQAASHLATVGAATFLAWVSGVDLLLPNAPEAVALGGDLPMLEAATGGGRVRRRAGGALAQPHAYLGGRGPRRLRGRRDGLWRRVRRGRPGRVDGRRGAAGVPGARGGARQRGSGSRGRAALRAQKASRGT